MTYDDRLKAFENQYAPPWPDVFTDDKEKVDMFDDFYECLIDLCKKMRDDNERWTKEVVHEALGRFVEMRLRKT